MSEVQPRDEPGPGASAADTSGAGLLLTSEQRRHMRLWLGVLGCLATCSLIGTGFVLYLVNHQPLLLIVLSPLGRHLLLVAQRVDPLAFVVVGGLRRFAFYLPCFELGRELGAPALDLLDRRTRGLRPVVAVIQRVFARAPHLAVFALPGPLVAALAGIEGVRRSVYVPLVLAGLSVRMWIWLELAVWAQPPIGALLEWIDRYWIEGTALLVLGIALQQWRLRRRSARDALG